MNDLLKLRRKINSCKTLIDVIYVFKKYKINPLYSFSNIYDVAYKGDRGDKVFYSQLIKKSKTPLYVGVGTGRIFAKLSKINSRIQGIDKSKKMIQGMLKTYPKISIDKLIVGDILKHKFSDYFDAVIAPFSFLTQFEFKNSLKIAKSINKILLDDGVFCSDFYSPYDAPINTNIQITPIITNPKIGSFFMVYCYSENNKKLTEYTVIHTNKKILVLELNLHTYYPEEILYLFKKAGFSRISIKSGFLKRKNKNQSAPLVVSAYKLGNKQKK